MAATYEVPNVANHVYDQFSLSAHCMSATILHGCPQRKDGSIDEATPKLLFFD